MNTNLQTKRDSYLFLAVAILFLLVRLLVISSYPLIDPSEGRYAEISREMVATGDDGATGDWIVPHLDPDLPFWGKPPLYFWLAALCIKVFGLNEFSVRLPSFLFLCSSLLIMYFGAAGVFGSVIRARAALILTSTGLFYVLSGLTLVDSAFCFAVTVALTSLFLQRYWCWGILFAFGITLSLLAKGFLAILILVPAACCWEFFAQAHTRVKTYSLLKLFAYIALGIAASVPWHILAEFHTPGFLSYYIIGEHFRRFTEPGWVSMYGSAHIEPYGFIWLFLGLSLLPWALLFPSGIIRSWQKKKLSNLNLNCEPIPLQIIAFLLVWALLIPIIFTFSSGTMIPYLLPSLPAWSILLSLFIERYLDLSPKKVVYLSSVVPAGFVLAALFILPLVGARRSEAWIKSGLVAEDDRLTYIERLPYSAQFYSDGEATNLKGLTTNIIEERLDDLVSDIYVVEKKNTKDVTLLENNPSLKKILDNPKNIVFKESPKNAP